MVKFVKANLFCIHLKIQLLFTNKFAFLIEVELKYTNVIFHFTYSRFSMYPTKKPHLYNVLEISLTVHLKWICLSCEIVSTWNRPSGWLHVESFKTHKWNWPYDSIIFWRKNQELVLPIIQAKQSWNRLLEPSWPDHNTIGGYPKLKQVNYDTFLLGVSLNLSQQKSSTAEISRIM